MSRLGPVLTLAAGAVLAAGLGVASITATPVANRTPAASDTGASGEPTAGKTDDTTDTGAETPAPEKSTEPATPSPSRTAKGPVKADYAGRVDRNGGLIAISVRGDKAIGYFCDGRTEAWFKGDAAEGKIGLEGFGGAAAGAGLGGGKATGWLKVGGKRWTFTAPTVRKPSGLYRATAQVRGAKIRAGWIVLKRPQGGFTQVGAAFEGDEQIDVPQLDGDRPTDPVTAGDTTLHPKDVDGFIEEMR
ncbi:hypothetical protein [Nonomuraea roseoviolacea]|uniref:Serine/threonine protein kinase n=1 Tax=Nonomuraea roseoviolacea subsp. carminata TaxID=160689 RepID=A0ABT1K3F1_9ACTN|nr:hypothetical protein [Nonomuraea roseoviolacea]MCP2348525.1 hypothetical protein [Nonomuraea roseoviolacea subsp. carminata]